MPDKYFFIAKSDYPIEDIKTHTGKLLTLFKKFKEMYGNEKYGFDTPTLELIELACEYHDLGKMSSGFQNYIKDVINKKSNTGKVYDTDERFRDLYKRLNIKQIPHGILSCAFLDIAELEKKYTEEEITILVSAIYHHHVRKLEDKNGGSVGTTTIKKIVDEELKYYSKFYDEKYNPRTCGIIMNAISENGISSSIKDKYDFWLKFIVVKGMLNKLDYAASAYIKSDNKVGLDALEIETNDASLYVENKFKNRLNDCQEFMKNNADKSIVVIASTGIGKTEGALLWAGSSKTFYTLPIKVSINAIYKRIIDEGYYGSSESDKEKVTFLHSDTRNIMMEKYNDEDDYEKKYLETKQLIHPLTVCTIDQLFYFVFKSLGTEKFPATLKYSKVIIDEIQSYTPDITAFIIYGLKVITDLGGKFCIMTATLPPVVKYFLINEIGEDKMKIAAAPYFKRDNNGDIIERHRIKYIEGDFDYNEIVKQAGSKKVLVICNTVKRSQDVYAKLKEENNDVDINLLHSRFILKDRKLKEHCILEFAKRGEKGIWLSTQIVEASLDIDFDILYTDMCTADSLLQRMGRCYRNRPYDNEKEANVIICRNDDKSIGVGTVYDKDIFNFSAEYIKKYSGNIFSEESKIKYIDDVYNVERLKAIDNEKSYYNSIKYNLDTLEKLSVGSVDKKITEHQFRNINNITVIPLEFKSSVDELLKEIEESNDKKHRISKIDEIKSYTTSIFYNAKYKDNIQKFEKGKIKERYLNDIVYIDLPYDKEIGLRNRTDDELEEFEKLEREKQFL